MDKLNGIKRRMKSQPPRKTVQTNPELMLPFYQGWRRELVYRNVQGPNGVKCDSYYHTPEGVKLRSMTEIRSVLKKQKCQLSPENFYVSRHLIGAGSKFEIERTARADWHSLPIKTKTKVRPAGGATSPRKRHRVMKAPQKPAAKDTGGGRQDRPAPAVVQAPARNSGVRLVSRQEKKEPEQKSASAGVAQQMAAVARVCKAITVTRQSLLARREENSVRSAKPRQPDRVPSPAVCADARDSKPGRTVPEPAPELQSVPFTKPGAAVHVPEKKPELMNQGSTTGKDREARLKHGLGNRKAVIRIHALPRDLVEAAQKRILKFGCRKAVKPRMKVIVKQPQEVASPAGAEAGPLDSLVGSVFPPAWGSEKPPERLVVTELSGSWCLINRPSNAWTLSYVSAMRKGPLFYRQPRPLPVGRIQPESPCHLFCFAKGGSARWAVLPALQCLACCCLFHQYCVGLPTQPTPDNFLCKGCNDLLQPEYARALGLTGVSPRADTRLPPTFLDISSDEENHPPQPAPPRRVEMPLSPPHVRRRRPFCGEAAR